MFLFLGNKDRYIVKYNEIFENKTILLNIIVKTYYSKFMVWNNRIFFMNINANVKQILCCDNRLCVNDKRCGNKNHLYMKKRKSNKTKLFNMLKSWS